MCFAKIRLMVALEGDHVRKQEVVICLPRSVCVQSLALIRPRVPEISGAYMDKMRNQVVICHPRSVCAKFGIDRATVC